MNIRARPPVIASKHELTVLAKAAQAERIVKISIHVAKKRKVKSNLFVARIYGICKFLRPLLQFAERKIYIILYVNFNSY